MLVEELKERMDLFENPSYVYFTLSGLCGTLANGLNYIALSWLAYNTHNAISGVAMMMFFLWMPSIVFAPLLGVMADRYSRKALMTLSNSVRGITLLAFTLLWQQGLEPNILLLSAVVGLFIAFYLPAAVPYIQSIVPKEKLISANATIDMIYELGTVIGMGLSGVLIATLGIEGTLAISGGLFVVAGIFNLLMQSPKTTIDNQKQGYSWWQDYCESLRYFRRTPKLLIPYINLMIVSVLLMTVPVILVPYTKEVLNADTQTFAFYEALYSLGVMVGGLLSPVLCRKFTTSRTLALLLMVLSFGLFSLSINSRIDWVFPIYFMIGFGLSSWALSITLTQLHCNPDFQGRMQANFNAISGAFILLLYLLMAHQGSNVSSQQLYLILSLLAASGMVFIVFSNQDSEHAV